MPRRTPTSMRPVDGWPKPTSNIRKRRSCNAVIARASQELELPCDSFGAVWAGGDDSAVARLPPVKGQVMSAAVRDGSTRFRHEKSSCRNIPFIFRFQCNCCLNAPGCGECKYPGD